MVEQAPEIPQEELDKLLEMTKSAFEDTINVIHDGIGKHEEQTLGMHYAYSEGVASALGTHVASLVAELVNDENKTDEEREAMIELGMVTLSTTQTTMVEYFCSTLKDRGVNISNFEEICSNAITQSMDIVRSKLEYDQ